jgi:hypothetical protein
VCVVVMTMVMMVIVRMCASNCRDGDCCENDEGNKAAHLNS